MKRETEQSIFGPAKRVPQPVRDAVLTLAAESPPTSELEPAAHLLWRTGKRLSNGKPEGEISRSVVSLAQELHELSLSPGEAFEAAKRASQRYHLAMKGKTSKKPKNKR